MSRFVGRKPWRTRIECEFTGGDAYVKVTRDAASILRTYVTGIDLDKNSRGNYPESFTDESAPRIDM
jgi:hypothetical protein